MGNDANLHDELLALETAAWQALTEPGAATGYYDDTLADDVLMLFPGGMVIDDREAVVASMDGALWSSFEITEPRVLRLGDDAAVFAYRVHAVRQEQDYDALLNSTYVREAGEWHLALHQQTPV
ncbi:MAG: nuclear transport factor 2 family protein [Acidimicrobiia bacterium]